jgi:hypothetical protein
VPKFAQVSSWCNYRGQLSSPWRLAARLSRLAFRLVRLFAIATLQAGIKLLVHTTLNGSWSRWASKIAHLFIRPNIGQLLGTGTGHLRGYSGLRCRPLVRAVCNDISIGVLFPSHLSNTHNCLLLVNFSMEFIVFLISRAK